MSLGHARATGEPQPSQFRFDALRAAIGWSGPQRTHVIEAGRIAAFRDAIGDNGVTVPPTFLACLIDTPPLLPEASLYGSGWLNGGDRFRYVSAVRVGQTVTSQMRFTDAVEKRGSSGPMAILTFITTFAADDGSTLVEHTGTRIRR
jgi:hypothetical protein